MVDDRMIALARRRVLLPWSAAGLAVQVVASFLLLVPLASALPTPPFYVTLPILLASPVGAAMQFVRIHRQNRLARSLGGNLCPRCIYPLDPAARRLTCPECGNTYTRSQLNLFWR
jgi:hypothetical protein